jgi:hypothetical protein
MGARQKLNSAYAAGSVALAGLTGFLAQSWVAFLVAGLILLVLNIASGDIRPRKRERD